MRIVRTISMLLLLCALTISSKAQSPTQNYVMSKEVLGVGGTHAITTVTYYDGLVVQESMPIHYRNMMRLAGKSRAGFLEQRSQVAPSCLPLNCLPLS